MYRRNSNKITDKSNKITDKFDIMSNLLDSVLCAHNLVKAVTRAPKKVAESETLGDLRRSQNLK